jgi:membrane associated rhomboid family serine protease
MTPVIGLLLALNAVAFLLQGFGGSGLVEAFALWPLAPEVPLRLAPGFAPWQLVTYAFLHGGMTHLFFNMFALWMFGSQIELRWGARRFAFYYLFCVIGAGALQLMISTSAAKSGMIYPTIGASGGVFGVLLAFGMMFPNQRIVLLFPPIPIKAKWFVLGYGVLELWMGITGTQPGIAHFAHLGGMLFGLVLILYWRGKLPVRPDRTIPW